MKLIRKNLNLPEELIKDVEEFRVRMLMTSFTAALIELVRRGLKFRE